ncbi:quinon protein alcohol dehydrogenase-like superfamily [Mycena floridula]|nr:quinon protein alcohol dehydrogenase-like superfamily [Mycena floridula]
MKKKIQALQRWTTGRRSKTQENSQGAPAATTDFVFHAAGPSQPTAAPEFKFQMEGSTLNVQRGDVNSHNTVNQTIVNNIAAPKDDGDILRKIDQQLESRSSGRARVTRIEKLSVCYKGTREDILRQIDLWISGNETNNRCLCIVGIPGSGKSTIAATVARELLDASNSPRTVLIAEFFIRRGFTETSDLDNIIPTIAQQLYQLSTKMAEVIRNALSARPTLVYPISNAQIDELFLAPLCAISKTIVIIIDALDELIEPALFSQFLAYLIPKLPFNARLLLTTRNENDILIHLDPLITKISLELHVSDSVDDVKYYITEKLRDNLRLKFLDDEEWRNWPTPAQIQSLSNHASGLFIWGATAVSHITQFVYDEGVSGRDEALAEVNSLGMNDLDVLYGFILRRLLPKSNPSTKLDHICRVIGLLIVSPVLLSVGTIREFLSIKPHEFDIKHFIQRARSVLLPGIVQVDDDSIPQLHNSFVDFITSPRAKEFQIHEPYHHGLALCCALKSMEALHFNMCSLESSHLENQDVRDLEKHLIQIPYHIRHSCHYWGYHLRWMGKDELFLLAKLKDFMEIQFLFWLEILSLSGSFSIAAQSMKILADWLKDQSEPFKHFVQDAAKFIISNRYCIASSAPHIYISALPLSPSSSPLANHYLPQYPRTMSVVEGRKVDWDAALVVIDRAHSRMVCVVTFSPDGKCIAAGGMDEIISIWDLGGSLLAYCEGHRDTILSIGFSPDSRQIVSGSWDHTVCVWDAQTGDLVVGPLTGHHSPVNSVAFSPDGKYIASGSHGDTVIVWNAVDGQMITSPLEESEANMAVAFSSDGSHIIAVSADASVQIWNIQDSKLVGGSSGPCITKDDSSDFDNVNLEPTWIALSSDGQHVAAAIHHKIWVWEAETGHIIQHFKLQGYWLSVAFSPDGSHLIAGYHDGVVTLDLHSGVMDGGPFHHEGRTVTSAAFSFDGQYFMSGCYEGAIYVWNMYKQTTDLHFHGHQDRVQTVAFSPGGKTIASGSDDQTVQIWDTSTGELVAGPFKHSSYVCSVAFSPIDGHHLASGGVNGQIHIWDIKAGVVAVGPFQGHAGCVYSVSFSPDGLQIASAGSWDDTIRIWNAMTGESLLVLCRPKHCFYSVAFSPNGQHITAGSDDGTLHIWHAMAGNVVGVLNGDKEPVISVAFSPDGIHIASGSWNRFFGKRPIHIWNLETCQIVHRLVGHDHAVKSIVFSPDGHWVISGSADCTVRVWDMKTGSSAAVLRGHTESVDSVQISSDGTCLASSSADHSIRIWDFSGIVKSINLDASDSESGKNHLMYRDNSELKDGWIKPGQQLRDPLLFWAPPINRKTLWRPNNIAVIGKDALRLDFSNFVHGADWTRCREALH